MAVLFLVAPTLIAVAPLPVHLHCAVSTFMPFFLHKENERLSTFMHGTLWRQQLFMHMCMHFVISFAQCCGCETACAGGAFIHQNRSENSLVQCTFPAFAWRYFLSFSTARRCDSSTNVVVKRHASAPRQGFGCDNLQRSHILCIYTLKTIRFFEQHTVRHLCGGVK